MTHSLAPVVGIVLGVCAASGVSRTVATPDQGPAPPVAVGVVWDLDNLTRIGGHAVTVLGSPRVVQTPEGQAIEFDGVDDGLVLDANPIAGLERFTIEVLFEPAPDGPEEQRFLHIQEATTENRALLELRLLPGARWTLDTYLRWGAAGVTLLDRRHTHPVSGWQVASLTWDGRTMAHAVDGVVELSAAATFAPLGPGRTSIGVRQNLVSWFKGKIRQVQVKR